MNLLSVLAVGASTIASAYALEEQETTVSGSLFVAGSMLVVASGLIGLATQILDACHRRRQRLEQERAESPPRTFGDMTIHPSLPVTYPLPYITARSLGNFPPLRPDLSREYSEVV